jgi:hypothetical protein
MFFHGQAPVLLEPYGRPTGFDPSGFAVGAAVVRDALCP